MKTVIVGGVAGGATAAARLRRLDEHAEILILERSAYVSYANCGLPYYIGGVIEKEEELTIQTPESLKRRFQIDVRVRSEVTKIDRAKKTVTVKQDGKTYTESYDKLILSPGAKAVTPAFESDKLFTLRTVEDTANIKRYLDKTNPKTAIVIGGGFIGLEMAENLITRGVKTILMQRGDHILPPFDFDMASQLNQHLRQNGLDLRFEQNVEQFEEKNNQLIVTANGVPIAADFVLFAAGVVPETHLAAQAGLQLGIKGAIVVNDRMQTSDPDIYAVGDAVQIHHFVTQAPAHIALAGPANKQGRIAADNIYGLDSRFQGAQGSSVIRLFDMTAAATGLNETAAKQANIEYDKVVTYSPDHATYYPGASNMTIKTLFEQKSGRIIGAQITGFSGVDKRIDVLATAIRAKMTAADLAELDLAYAPPYSSAKDPVNMAGFVIENIRSGLVRQHHPEQIKSLQKQDGTFLDVRTNAEFAAGHLPRAINIPLDSLRQNLNRIDKNKPVYVNCQSGLRSYIACRILSAHGFTCSNLSGGYRFYQVIEENQ